MQLAKDRGAVFSFKDDKTKLSVDLISMPISDTQHHKSTVILLNNPTRVADHDFHVSKPVPSECLVSHSPLPPSSSHFCKTIYIAVSEPILLKQLFIITTFFSCYGALN